MIKAGDRVRYSRSFIESHENQQMAGGFAELEGVVLAIHVDEVGLEIAQIDFGTIFRCSSMVPVANLEKIDV